MIPDRYTHTEGGEWQPWPIGDISYNELRTRRFVDEYPFTHTSVVLVCDVQKQCILVHSLMYKNQRWDYVNGWNDGQEPE